MYSSWPGLRQLARKKNDVHLVCTVRLTLNKEDAALRRAPRGVTEVAEAPYALPPLNRASSLPPVVVGMGPAGLFAALTFFFRASMDWRCRDSWRISPGRTPKTRAAFWRRRSSHSRYTEITMEQLLEKPELEILALSHEAGQGDPGGVVWGGLIDVVVQPVGVQQLARAAPVDDGGHAGTQPISNPFTPPLTRCGSSSSTA